VSVADRDGVWLTGDDIELRWRPADLLVRNLHVISLTAGTIDIARAPVAQPASPKQSGGFSLPRGQLTVDHLRLAALRIAAPLAGTPVDLAISGAAHLRDLQHGHATLTAVAADGRGVYALDAAFSPRTIATAVHIAEPPDGLLGHFAGPQVHSALAIDLTLKGPRTAAQLQFSSSLGAAQLNGAGTLDLDPQRPGADVVFTIPALAPFAAFTGSKLAGATTLHLIAATQPDQSTTLDLDGNLDLTSAPGPAAALVGPHGHIGLVLRLARQAVTIRDLALTGAGFAAEIDGTVASGGAEGARVDLNIHLQVTDPAALSPGLHGEVAEDGSITGTAGDFAVDAQVTGTLARAGQTSGPFKLTVAADHLPRTPTGTLTAAGALESAPLVLDAAFARDEAGDAHVTVTRAAWRSLTAQGAVALAKGATLPTGTASFAVGNLADFRAFSPVKLAGSLTGDFAHQASGDFTLNLAARRLLVSPQLGPIDASLTADGPAQALAVRASASLAQLLSAPARIATGAVLNLDARSANLTGLTADWHGLHLALQGPAAIETRPGIAVRHLVMGLNGGSIRLNGSISPRLDATLAVSDLPASLAGVFVPSLDATGTLDATAAVTGSAAHPAGRLTFDAHDMALHSGPAAALPAVDLAAAATVAGQSAQLRASLAAGPNLTLNAAGTVPLTSTGGLNLHVSGRTDLRLTDPILAAQGSILRGIVTPDVTVTGTPSAPLAQGGITLAGGSVENIGSGLNLTQMSAAITGAGRLVTLQDFKATAGHGTITGHGSVDLGTAGYPIDLALNADNATPVASDLVTETLDAVLTLRGALLGALALDGDIDLRKANINIPKSLPPSVANLPIVTRGAPPAPPPPPPPPIALDLRIRAANQIFIRGDGLFAELGGKLRLTGTAADPQPQGGFTLIRGDFSLAGTALQFTQGTISFTGAGFMPTLDLEATSTTSTGTATLVVGGTAAAPTITLTGSPPEPSDALLAQLLFGTGTQNLTAFQAASLAAALAQLAGVGGGGSPLDSVRNALGLDELSLGGSGNGPPSVQAGRYIAPGVYVGATQATNGQGTQATVQINLYKGLKLQTATGAAGSGSGNASSVGLTYQFNY
jgi:translocation and assembly module TamB